MRHMLGNLSPNYFERTKRYMMLRASRQGTDLTVSGTPPLSLSNSLGKPLKAWSVDLLPYQEGTCDPAPDNVRPIHGTDKVTVTTAGKNLLEPKFYGNVAYNQSVGGKAISTTPQDVTSQVSINGNTYSRSGSAWDKPMSMILDVHAFVGSSLTLSGSTSEYTSGMRFGWYVTSEDYTVMSRSGDWTRPVSNTFNIQAGDYYIILYINSAGSADAHITEPMIEVGSTATPYTPYLAPSQTVIDVPPLGKNLYNMAQYPFKQFAVYNPSVAWTDPMLLQKGTYTFSCNTVFGACYIRFYATLADATANTNMIFSRQFAGGSSTTYTLDTDLYVRYQQNNTSGTQEDYDQITHAWQTELGSSATSYEPYNSTVYTGTIGSDGGKSMDAKKAFDGSNDEDWVISSAWGKTNTTVFYISNVLTDALFTSYDNAFITHCNEFIPMSRNTLYDSDNIGVGYSGTFNPSIPSLTVRISKTIASTVGEFRAFLASNPLEIVYPTVTPTQFSITPPTIPTPTGTATTWATAENGTVDGMEVTYVGKA